MKFTPKQEIPPKQTDRAWKTGVEAGQGPTAMSHWPLWQLVQDLDGFDFVAFLLGAVVVFFSVGFAIDYIVGRQGMGPYWNSFYATVGAYAGLCAHDWWLRRYVAFEPYLTLLAIAGGLLATVVTASAVAKR